MNRYIIGTGFYAPRNNISEVLERNDFLETWLENTLKTSDPIKIYIVSSDSAIDNKILESYNATKIVLDHNPGHSLQKNNSIMCGWQASFIISAMIAYNSNCDFIYKEQDCLCFGQWINHLYSEHERTKSPVLMGKLHADPSLQNEISLIFVKRDFIPKLVQTLIMILDEKLYGNPYPEKIMGEVAEICGCEDYYFSMGYGRDRPINYDDEAFYVQHIGFHKYETAIKTTRELKERRLI